MTLYKLENNQPLLLGREIGSGGEAIVYSVSDDSGLVAKIYRKPDITRTAKLRAMLANPPDEFVAGDSETNHISIAWPYQLVFDPERQCVGFLMPYIKATSNLELSKLYNPQDRRQNAPGFSWKYLLRAARNIAAVIENLHYRNHIVGDLNESNWLVSNAALVTLVDCDSIQVKVTNAGLERVYRCPVGKAEYTPPELQGCNFNLINRDANHDNFSLAVLIFLLLMEGVHPYQGRWLGAGEPPGIAESIERGLCPYIASQTQIKPPLFGLPFNILPLKLQALMVRCFSEGHKNPSARPRAAEWQAALSEAENNLLVCPVNTQHYYSNHLEKCPWCERVAKGFADSFPPREQLARLLEEAQLPRTRKAVAPRPRPAAVGIATMSSSQPIGVSYSSNQGASPPILWNVLWLGFAVITTIFALLISFISAFNKSGNNQYYANFNQTIGAARATATDLNSYFGTQYINNATGTALSSKLGANILATPAATLIRTPVTAPQVTLFKTLTGHTGAINTIAFSADGKTLASGGNDKTVKLWDTGTGQELPTLITNYNPITSLSFDPLRQILLSVGAYGPIKLWNTATGEQLNQAVSSNLRYANTVLFSTDGKTLIVTDAYDATFYRVDTTTGRFDQINTLPLSARRNSTKLETIFPLVLSQDGKTLALENQDHSLSVLNESSLIVEHSLFGHSDKVLGLAISLDGHTLASGGTDRQLIIWDIASGQALHKISNLNAIGAVAINPAGTIVAAGSYDGTLKLWDVASGNLLETVTTSSDKILSVAFSPDGKILAVAGADKNIRLWTIG